MFNNNNSGGKLSTLVVATAPGRRSQEVEYPALAVWLTTYQIALAGRDLKRFPNVLSTVSSFDTTMAPDGKNLRCTEGVIISIIIGIWTEKKSCPTNQVQCASKIGEV